MEDTDARANQVRIRILRAMSPARRLAMAAGWSTTLRDLTRARLRMDFSAASEEELKRLFAERWLGAELTEKVYGSGDVDG